MSGYHLTDLARIHTPDVCSGRSDCRPVVVIDPEDREQVERLAIAIRDASSPSWVDATQAALRSLIAPPKPPEPQGLGAVVEDAEGSRWVRYDADCYVGPRGTRGWKHINAVRVLSPGWSE